MRGSADEVVAMVEAVRGELAPDPRHAVFEVEVQLRGDVLALVGATSELEALRALRHGAAQLTGWAAVVDEVQLLPEAEADERVHAVVTAAVAPMMAGPGVRNTQVSQVVLGNRLLVLRRERRWLQCRSPDAYIGWVHAGYLALMGEADARGWESGADGDVWISLGAEVRTADHEVLVRLPWGARVLREAEKVVRLPDRRVGRPHGELVPAAAVPIAFPPRGEAICETAARWMGVPYLWGGVTMGGVDCSGFVQACYRMHGVVIPRDSDQQSCTGDEVVPEDDFHDLLPGDLLFFTEEEGRITHVTMSTGGSRIIHSSLGNGGVARNDLMGRRSYERELRRLFVCARRYI